MAQSSIACDVIMLLAAVPSDFGSRLESGSGSFARRVNDHNSNNNDDNNNSNHMNTNTIQMNTDNNK